MAEGHVSATIQRFPAVLALCKQNLDENSPEGHLTDLGRAIRRLDQAVARLQRTIEQHNRIARSHANGDGRGMHALSLDGGSMTRANQFVENFRRALANCEMFLSDRPFLRTTATNLSPAVQQELSTLQQTLTGQAQALILFLAEIPALVSGDGTRRVAVVPGSYSLTAVRQDTLVDPFALPDSIAQRFRQVSSRNPPSGFTSPEEFSLRLGLAAILHHYSQSTAHSAPGVSQTIHQYLSLLKMQWLIQCIERLPAYKVLEQDDPDRVNVNRYRNVVFSERRRADVPRWKEADVLALTDNFYTMWPPIRAADHLHNPTQARNTEKQILALDIRSQGRDSGYILRVMRVLKSATGTAVRIVRKRSHTDPEDTPIDSFKDGLIPLYAFRRSHARTYALAVRKADYHDEQIFEFDNCADLYRLQRTLTSYAVASDFDYVDWAVARSSLFAKPPNGQARKLQIWLWDPEDALPQIAKEAGYGNDADSRQSIVSQLTAQSALTILHDSAKPHVSVSTKDRTRYTNTEVVEAVMPYEPWLIMYTEYAGQKCYLSLELNSQVVVDPTTCSCTKKPEKCNRVVLRSRSGDLTFTRIKTKGNNPDSIPDLNLFARSYRKGQEAHPSLRNPHLVERFEGGHIVLDFPTVELRKMFNKHFTLAYKLRSSIESTDRILETRAQFIADKPEGKGNPRDRIVGPSHMQQLQNQAKASTSSFGGSSGGRYRSSTSDYERNAASSSRSSSLTTENSRPRPAPAIIPPISELGDRNASPVELHSQSFFGNPAHVVSSPQRGYSRDAEDGRPWQLNRTADTLRSAAHDIVSPCSPPRESPPRQHVILSRGIDPSMLARQPAKLNGGPTHFQRRDLYELQ